MRRIVEVFTDPLLAADGDDPVDMGDESENPGTPTTYSWTEREYVWGPSYVDELVCQIGGGESASRQNIARYALPDANFNVAALVGGQGTGSLLGTVMEQYTYDPYGLVLFTDTFATGGTSADPTLPRNRVGHQGLFADRFAAATAAAQLGPGGKVLYHNRNRSYLAWLGRFAQKDPNGTGSVTPSLELSFGMSSAIRPVEFDHAQLFGDGANIYAYQSNEPVVGSDSMGLFESIVGLLGASTTLEDLEVDAASNALDTGNTMRGALDGLFGNYGVDQMMDAEWASDWSAGDDDYSKSIRAALSTRIAERERGGPVFARTYAWNALRGHHLITRFGPWSSKFRSLLRRHRLKLADVNRVVDVQWRWHKGKGHSAKYHQLVWNRLVAELGNKVGPEASEAVSRALDWIEDYLRRHPEILRAK